MNKTIYRKMNYCDATQRKVDFFPPKRFLSPNKHVLAFCSSYTPAMFPTITFFISIKERCAIYFNNL